MDLMNIIKVQKLVMDYKNRLIEDMIENSGNFNELMIYEFKID